MMGGNLWLDKDQFAERDLTGLLQGKDAKISQNDLRNPNRSIKVGDKFGYDYDIDIIVASAFLQNQWTLSDIDLYYAAKVTYTEFSRYGRMESLKFLSALTKIPYGSHRNRCRSCFPPKEP